MQAILEERGFPVDELRLFASARSAGRTLAFRGGRRGRRGRGHRRLRRASTSPCSRAGPPPRASSPRGSPRPGPIVIDNSSAWRMDPDVPLVVPEVNERALTSIPKGIVANPNCTTMVAMPVLKPLHDAAGLTRAGGLHLPGGVAARACAGVAELDEQLGQAVDGARRPSPSTAAAVDRPGAVGVPRPHRPQRRCPSPARWSTTARARPTRSRSSATRAARSSASPTWR